MSEKKVEKPQNIEINVTIFVLTERMKIEENIFYRQNFR